MNKSITENQFLSFTLENISQVYSGKRNICRCGCGGVYTATSFMEEPRSDVNDKLVLKRLNRVKKLIESGVCKDVLYGSNFIDVQTGNDRTLTFYVDELIGQD